MKGLVETRLYIDGKSLARALTLVSSRVSSADLRAANEANRQKLQWRVVDYFTLALILCIETLNSLTEDDRTGLEESPVNAVMGMLKHMKFGRQAYGTVVRVARELLVKANLIHCTDASFRIDDGNYQGSTGQCRKWIPVGQTWSLPFVSDIEYGQLSPAQQESRNNFLLNVQRRAEQHQPAQHSFAFAEFPTHSPYYGLCISGLSRECGWEGMEEAEIALDEYESYLEALSLGL